MGTRGKRYLVLAFALGALLAMVLASPAQAVTIKGGDATHRTAALNVLRSQPGLLAFVESVYPGFTVWIGYGGHAWEGRIDVNGSRSGKAFTDQVAHEFCHEIQRAADAAGGPPALSGPWRDELIGRGFGPETWVWGIYAPLKALVAAGIAWVVSLAIAWLVRSIPGVGKLFA